MKQGVKTFLQIFGGFVAGGGIATAVTYKLTTKKYMKISDERVKSLEEYNEKLQMEILNRDLGYGKVESEDSKGSEGGKNGVSSGSNVSEDERLKPYQEVKPDGTVYTRYSRISDSNGVQYKSSVDERYEQIAAELEHPMDDDPEDDDEDDGLFGKMTQAEREYEAANRSGGDMDKLINSNSLPFVIEEDELGADGFFEVDELYFYAGDGTMLSENEEIMPSPEDVLGNCLDSSGFRNDRNTLLCVRNPRRSTDYKITKVFHSYSDKDIR